MSWDSYISDQLIATGNVDKGAICGLDGNVWAITPGWGITQQEVSKLVAGFKDSGPLAMSGMMVAGEKFFFISANDETIRGKQGQDGIHICKTKTAIILGKYVDPIQPGQCSVTVEALAEYLRGVNF